MNVQKDHLVIYYDLPNHILTAINELQKINAIGYTLTIEYPFLCTPGLIVAILNLQKVSKDITEFHTGVCGKGDVCSHGE